MSDPIQNDTSSDTPYLTAEEIATYLDMPVEEFHVIAGHHDLEPVEVEKDTFRYRAEEVKQLLVNVGAIEGDGTW